MEISRERWPSLMDIRLACDYLQVKETTFRSLIAERHFAPVRIRRSLIRYRRSDLDRFIESLEEGGGISPNDR